MIARAKIVRRVRWRVSRKIRHLDKRLSATLRKIHKISAPYRLFPQNAILARMETRKGEELFAEESVYDASFDLSSSLRECTLWMRLRRLVAIVPTRELISRKTRIRSNKRNVRFSARNARDCG